jgi:hypothetical protein
MTRDEHVEEEIKDEADDDGGWRKAGMACGEESRRSRPYTKQKGIMMERVDDG